ncbi:Zinc finger C2H2, partial [Penicillium hetheringtonii]
RFRVQLNAAILFYRFIFAKTEKIHESTVQRKSAKQLNEEESDKIFEICIMAYFILTIEFVDKESMIVLTYEKEYIKNYYRKNE